MDGESVLSGYLRETPGGAGVANGAVTVKLHSNNEAVGGMTDTTDANGFWDISSGYPGAFYVEVVSGSVTKVQSSKITGFVGTFALRDLPLILRAFSDGYVAGFGDNLAVVVNTGMSVTVGTGMAVIHGNGYYHAADENVTLTAADGTFDRIDLVVVRFTKPGNTDPGKRELVVIAGTPAGSPVVPAPLDTSNFKDLPLAQILVPTGTSSVTSDRITDRRVQAGPTSVDPNNVTGLAEVIRDTIGAALVAGSNITITVNDAGDTITIAAANPGVTVQEGDTTVSTATVLDFDASDFTISESPAGEANITLAYGTGAGTPAEGDHTHTGVYAPQSHKHDLVLTRFAQANKSYVATGPITSQQVVDSFSVGTSDTFRYNILAHGTYEGYADGGSSAEIQLGIAIDGGAISWGSQVSSENESAAISASNLLPDYTSTGASVVIDVYARRQTGSGNCYVRSGHAFAVAMPANTTGIE